jgi:outer membrane protein assembly factor BamB
MKLRISQPRPQHHTFWAAARLLLLLMCLLLLPACAPFTLPGTTSSANVSATCSNSPVAFVYTTATSTGTAGLVGASAKDGCTVWRAAVGHANWAPIIVGDTVYACVVGQGYTTEDIVAVRVATGQVLWRTKLPDDAFNYVINADTTTVVVDAGENGLYALNPQNGVIRWHLPLFVERKPLVHAGVVYALVDPQRFSLPSLNAYRASDGKLMWSVPLGGHNGRLELNSSAIFTDADTSQPAAFSLRDGHLLWSVAGGFVIAATDAAVFIQDKNYHLDALSVTDGSQLWQTSIDAGLYTINYDVAPVVNSVLYVAGSSGSIAAVRTRDGTLLWQNTSQNTEAVIVVNGVAYLYTSGSGGCFFGPCPDQVVARSAATGALLWQKSVPDGQELAEPVASD